MGLPYPKNDLSFEVSLSAFIMLVTRIVQSVESAVEEEGYFRASHKLESAEKYTTVGSRNLLASVPIVL